MAQSKQTKKQEVAETEVNLPMDFDFSQDAGVGFEGADKDSFAIPFLAVLQKNSPQVDEADAKFVEGAKPGMFYNTVTEELFDGKEGVTFMPCAYRRRFVRWGPRGTDKAGFKGEYFVEDVEAMRAKGEVVEMEGKLYFPDEHGEVSEKKCDSLKDTRNHFGLAVDHAGNPVQVLLSLTSTQIKKSKQLMSLLNNARINGVQPPTWVNKVLLTTVPESNDQGSWYGVRVTSAGFIQSRDWYEAGKAFHELISAGEATVNYEQADGGAEASGKF